MGNKTVPPKKKAEKFKAKTPPLTIKFKVKKV